MKPSTRICRVCGKEYPYCKTHRPFTVNRWQDVACCPEHGAQFFAGIVEQQEAPAEPAEAQTDTDITAEVTTSSQEAEAVTDNAIAEKPVTRKRSKKKPSGEEKN